MSPFYDSKSKAIVRKHEFSQKALNSVHIEREKALRNAYIFAIFTKKHQNAGQLGRANLKHHECTS